MKLLGLFKKFGPSLFAMGGGIGATFALHIAATNLATITVYGDFVYILSITGIFSMYMAAGLGMLQIRDVPRYGVKDAAKKKGFFNLSLIFLSATSVICFLLAGIVSNNITTLVLIVLPPIAFYTYFNNALKAFSKPALANSFEPLLKNLTFMVALLILHFAFEVTLLTIVISYIVILLTLAAIQYHLSWRNELKALRLLESKYMTYSWLKSAFPLLLLSSSYMLTQSTDVIVIGQLMNSESVAIYFVVFKLASIVLMVNGVLRVVVIPKISKNFVAGNYAFIAVEGRQVSNLSLALGVAVLAMFTAFGHGILSLYGDTYVAGYPSLLLLTAMFVFIVSLGPNDAILQMTDYAKLSLYIYLIIAFINVGFNFLLIPKFGLNGAASATGIALLFQSMLTMFFVKKKLGIFTFLGVNNR